jgi:hypothetical protein
VGQQDEIYNEQRDSEDSRVRNKRGREGMGGLQWEGFRAKGYGKRYKNLGEITGNKSFLGRINEARRIGAQTYIENAMDELEHGDRRNIRRVRERVG